GEYSPYNILFRLTEQMLAVRHVDDGLSLVLDACTSELGCAHAAIALANSDSEVLRIRMALGFPDDSVLKNRLLPSKIGCPFLTLPAGAEMAWIQRIASPDRDFLDEIGSIT